MVPVVPDDAQRRIAEDHVIWFTTITDSGAPAPYPVWFIADGDDLVVFSQPTARRVHNITQRPKVSLNFNSDAHGGDVWIITGTASVRHGIKPSGTPGYVDKYRASIEGELNTTVDDIDTTYDTEIRIHPVNVRTV